MSDSQSFDSLAPFNTLTQCLCMPVASILVLLRTWTRLKIVKKWGKDDYACCLAWAFLLVYGSMITVMTSEYGAGVHQWTLSPETVRGFLYYNNVTQILYGPFIIVTKTAILWFYSRTFAPLRQGRLDLFINLLIVTLALFYTGVTIVKIFQCTPRARIWDQGDEPGTCVNLASVLYTTGIVNSVSDILILVLPIHSIWHLQLRMRQKWGVSAVFAVGLIALVSAVFRLEVSFADAEDPDMTYYQLHILLWSEAEIATGVICCCLPTLPAFFRHYSPKKMGSGKLLEPNLPVHESRSSNRTARTVQFGRENVFSPKEERRYHPPLPSYNTTRNRSPSPPPLLPTRPPPALRTARCEADDSVDRGRRPEISQHGTLKNAHIEYTKEYLP